MGFSCRREPRVGWFTPAGGVSLSSTFTCPQSRVCFTGMQNGFSTVRSQILFGVGSDRLCCSWAHLNGEELET